jgi:hypothetical protein
MKILNRFAVRSFIFLVLILGGSYPLWGALVAAFQHNRVLNSIILSVLGVGIILILFQFQKLQKEKDWLDFFDRGEEKFPNAPKPVILAPMAILLSDYQGTSTHSQLAIRSVLSGVESRLDESRDVSRYLVGLLIFLGLLGTFWGLSQTIGAITGVITGIDVTGKEAKDTFQALKEGLKSPLAGMGTAFSSSMFGLASSLILGFLDLQYSKATTAFFHNLEEKLSIMFRSAGAETSLMASSGPAYTQSLLEQTVENMGQLQALMRRNEDNRASVVKAVQSLGEKLALLTEQTLVQQTLMKKIAQNQIDTQDILMKLSNNMTAQSTAPAMDEGIKQYLRNIDTTALKLLEELIEGRSRGVQDLKNEIKLVARTISALAQQEGVAA